VTLQERSSILKDHSALVIPELLGVLASVTTLLEYYYAAIHTLLISQVNSNVGPAMIKFIAAVLKSSVSADTLKSILEVSFINYKVNIKKKFGILKELANVEGEHINVSITSNALIVLAVINNRESSSQRT
jgi:hypothetical protein